MTGSPRRRLRYRLMAAFAGGALLLSVALSLLSFGLSRSYLLGQRQRSATRQAEVNARLVAGTLRSAVDVPQLLASLQSPTGSTGLVFHDGQWFAASLAVGRDALPAPIRTMVLEERSRVRQRFVLDGQLRLAVGLPLSDGAAYFEVFPFTELERTLGALRLSLVSAATATVAGATILGVWASRRVLDPLGRIGATAASIAGGQLDARLDVADDEELAALATSFNLMVDSLQERIEHDARFASNVSHELRSPLTALKSAVQAMQTRRSGLDERTARSLDLLAGEVSRFERLVQDLLEISRFDAGVVHASFDQVFLGELVLRALEGLGGGDVPLEVAAGATEVVVEADKRRLEQVVANLVENARIHGGGVARVGIEVDDDRARVAVEDHGPGIPDEDRRRVFERFFRGQQAGRPSGSGGVGLGLALVAEHARLHRGRVWVEEAEGGGARFVFELPVVRR
ncbi:MAG: sensor histidine kinase [Acidimicrobiia bacterium]